MNRVLTVYLTSFTTLGRETQYGFRAEDSVYEAWTDAWPSECMNYTLPQVVAKLCRSIGYVDNLQEMLFNATEVEMGKERMELDELNYLMEEGKAQLQLSVRFPALETKLSLLRSRDVWMSADELIAAMAYKVADSMVAMTPVSGFSQEMYQVSTPVAKSMTGDVLKKYLTHLEERYARLSDSLAEDDWRKVAWRTAIDRTKYLIQKEGRNEASGV